MDKKSENKNSNNNFQSICRFCSRKITTDYRLKKHLKKGCRCRDFSFDCPTCTTKQFKCYNPLQAIRHVSLCIPKGNAFITCCQCFKKVKSNEFALHYHDDILKYYLKNNQFKFTCETCGLKFPNEEDGRLHNQRHTKPDFDGANALNKLFTRYICSICLVTLFTKRNITEHMKNEHGLKVEKRAPMGERDGTTDKKRINARKPVYACYICEKRFYCGDYALHHIQFCEKANRYMMPSPKEHNTYKQEFPPQHTLQDSQERVNCPYCNKDITHMSKKYAQKVHIQNCEKKFRCGKSAIKMSGDGEYCPKCKRNIADYKYKQIHIKRCDLAIE